MCEFDKAEALYKNILREHPNYVDCKYGRPKPIDSLWFCVYVLASVKRKLPRERTKMEKTVACAKA